MIKFRDLRHHVAVKLTSVSKEEFSRANDIPKIRDVIGGLENHAKNLEDKIKLGSGAWRDANHFVGAVEQHKKLLKEVDKHKRLLNAHTDGSIDDVLNSRNDWEDTTKWPTAVSLHQALHLSGIKSDLSLGDKVVKHYDDYTGLLKKSYGI